MLYIYNYIVGETLALRDRALSDFWVCDRGKFHSKTEEM